MDEFLILVSQVGDFFFIQKFHHRILGSDGFFFFFLFFFYAAFGSEAFSFYSLG